MSDFKPLILYSHRGTPNPFKAALLLEELGVPYTVEDVGDRLKVEPYISINPNGRAPSISDPNTGVEIFEVRDIPHVQSQCDLLIITDRRYHRISY
jgi:glutathione S-transferase